MSCSRGESAKCLYEAWSQLPDFKKLTSVNFYFGDERCVPPSSSDSNYGMAMSVLFKDGIPNQCSVVRIIAEDDDVVKNAIAYSSNLPERIDILLLGVGLDGHIASIFPGSNLINDLKNRVVPVKYLSKIFNRITITPNVINHARSCFVLARGAKKISVLSRALSSPDQIANMPVRLVLNAMWLMDSA